MYEIWRFLVNIPIQEKSSPFLRFEPTTYKVAVYEKDDLPMCHGASVEFLTINFVNMNCEPIKTRSKICHIGKSGSV